MLLKIYGYEVFKNRFLVLFIKIIDKFYYVESYFKDNVFGKRVWFFIDYESVLNKYKEFYSEEFNV